MSSVSIPPRGAHSSALDPQARSWKSSRNVAKLRLVARLVGVTIVTVLGYLVWLFVSLILLAVPRHRRAWRRGVMGAWARTMCKILGVSLQITGAPPRSPGLLVSNHLGYMDILVLAGLVPAVFVAKAEIRGWPVLGALSAQFGTLFLERQRKRAIPDVNQRIARAIECGEVVAIFPEATSTKGDTVLPFRAGLLAPAASGMFPVWTASLSYETRAGDPPASQAVCWWGDMTFGPHVLKLFSLRGVLARVTFAPQAVRHPDRKELAGILWQQVHGAFTPVR